jgi:type I restriction enzyme, S subunit
MASEWSRVPLGDLTERDSPITYGVVKPGEESSDGVLLVRGGDIKHGQIDLTSLRTITKALSQQYKRTILRGGELVVSLVGEPGEVAIVPHSLAGANINRAVGLVRLRRDVNAAFVKYFLRSEVGHRSIFSLSLGSVQQVVNLSDLRRVLVPRPGRMVEDAIAHILGTLDDKIELNRRMNETLEAMALALFKSWFVDFDPVRAKTDGRDPSLSKPLADLFPDSFEDSELGEIPKGWQVKTIEQVAVRVGMGPFGSSIKVDSFVADGVPVISGQHLRGLMMEDNTFNFVSDEHAERLRAANVQRGDVVFTHAGNIGQVAFIPESSRYDRYVISQRQFFLRCDRTQISPSFVALFFRSPEGRHRLLSNASSSGVPSIARPVTYLRSIPLTIPPSALMRAFDRMVQPLFARFKRNLEEAGTHATLRDALLPKLVSGELRVSGA